MEKNKQQMNEKKSEDEPVRMVTRKELIDLGCNKLILDHVLRGRGAIDIEVLAKDCAYVDGKKMLGMKELLSKLDPPYEGEVVVPDLEPSEIFLNNFCGGGNWQAPVKGSPSNTKGG